MKSKVKLRIFFARMMLLTLSWGNFQIRGLYFYIIFQVLYIFFSFVKYRYRVSFRYPFAIRNVLIMHFVTCVSGLLSGLPSSFIAYSLKMTVVLIPSFFSYSYLMTDCRNDLFSFKEIKRWLKTGVLVQLVYLPVQYFLYKFVGIDSNKLFFSDFLHLMDNASFIREGTWFPSAFTWHSAYLAPMLVLAFLLFESNGIRLLVLLDSFICGNTTVLVGVLMAMICLALHHLINMEGRIRRKRLIELSGFLALIILYMFCFGGMEQITAKIRHVLQRFSINNADSSSAAHISYYTLYPQILSRQSIMSSFLGTGYASSGNAISLVNGQYRQMEHWVVESDVMDILISKGIVGFLVYYGFLVAILVCGRRLNYKYAIAMAVILFQGVTYNVQFEYILFIELLMLGTIQQKYDIFQNEKTEIENLIHIHTAG